jgi:DNA polymerase III gamma/tau subunit
MSKDAQDVLLKPVEDKKLVLIFCTTELPKIRSTIASRCETYEIRRIDRMDIFKRVQMILAQEGVSYEDDAVLTVIDIANGHVRDVLNKLETVAQLGPITVSAVRERLNLSVVSTFYEILLSLGNPAKAVRLVEEACDRVGPADVISGLAEAAMNSYRHAHKIYADFSVFDRVAAESTYAVLGDNLPKLAQFFLRNSYPSKLNLVCDVVTLCDTGGRPAPAEVQTTSAPPVLIQVQAPSTPDPTPSHDEVPAQETPSVTSTTTPVSKPSEVKPPSTPPPKLSPVEALKQRDVRSDGIGPKGSSDTFALGSLDHRAVPPDFPRGHNLKQQAVPLKKKGSSPEEARPMTRAEITLTLNSLRKRA